MQKKLLATKKVIPTAFPEFQAMINKVHSFI